MFVEKFPGGGQKTLVSSNGGPPAWSSDGREIYFTSSASGSLDMMVARVDLTPTLRVSAPRRLFSGRFMSGFDMGRSFSVTRDGRRFLMVRTPPGIPTTTGTGYAPELLVVQNCWSELRRKQAETTR